MKLSRPRNSTSSPLDQRPQLGQLVGVVLRGHGRLAQDQEAGEGDARRERERESEAPAAASRPSRPPSSMLRALASQQPAEGDQGDQGGGDRQGLGAGVDGAEGERPQVDDDRRGQRGGHAPRRGGESSAAARPPARRRPPGRRGRRPAPARSRRARREPEVARRPDPQRLERRELMAQVAEPAADRRRLKARKSVKSTIRPRSGRDQDARAPPSRPPGAPRDALPGVPARPARHAPGRARARSAHAM